MWSWRVGRCAVRPEWIGRKMCLKLIFCINFPKLHVASEVAWRNKRIFPNSRRKILQQKCWLKYMVPQRNKKKCKLVCKLKVCLQLSIIFQFFLAYKEYWQQRFLYDLKKMDFEALMRFETNRLRKETCANKMLAETCGASENNKSCKLAYKTVNSTAQFWVGNEWVGLDI